MKIIIIMFHDEVVHEVKEQLGQSYNSLSL